MEDFWVSEAAISDYRSAHRLWYALSLEWPSAKHVVEAVEECLFFKEMLGLYGWPRYHSSAPSRNWTW
jgi:hypothetical protein